MFGSRAHLGNCRAVNGFCEPLTFTVCGEQPFCGGENKSGDEPRSGEESNAKLLEKRNSCAPVAKLQDLVAR